MLNKTIKIIITLMIISVIGIMISQTVFADEVEPFKGWDTYSESTMKPDDSTGASEAVGNMANAILSVVQVVGIAVAVIMLIVLAIKYIAAAPSDKAEIKKHAVVYVLGAFIIVINTSSIISLS